MKKKILALCLAIALLVVGVVGSSIAWFKDTDSEVNVMTVGNVTIDLHEKNQNGDEDDAYQDWLQTQPFLPGCKIDKIVTVENTGTNPAYVRVHVAVPTDAYEAGIVVLNWASPATYSMLSYKHDINGVNHTIFVATYNEAVGIFGETEPCLTSVYMPENVDATTQSDGSVKYYTDLGHHVSENGKIDILVFAEGGQVSGVKNADGSTPTAEQALDIMFGEIGSYCPWPIQVAVTNANELSEALADAPVGAIVTLAPSTEYGTVEIGSELNRVTIQGAADANVKFNILGTAVLNDVTFTDLNVTYSDSSSAYVDGGIVNIDAGADVNNLVIADSVFNGSGGRSCVVGISEPTAEVTITNCVVDGPKYLVYASSPISKLTVEGCQISNLSSWAILENSGDAMGAELTITGNTFTNCLDGIAKYLGTTQPEGAFTVFTNNTLVNCAGHDGSDAKWFAIPGSADTVTVSGNTLDGAEWIPGVAQGLGK